MKKKYMKGRVADESDDEDEGDSPHSAGEKKELEFLSFADLLTFIQELPFLADIPEEVASDLAHALYRYDGKSHIFKKGSE